MVSLPISLQDGFIPSIKNGDQVVVGQVIASKTDSDEEKINVPKELAIARNKVKKVLKKSPGDEVKEGDIIAQKKSFLGQTVTLRSRVSGTVTRYERDSGNLVIKTGVSSEPDNLISPVDGIVSLCDNKQIVIDTEKNVLIAEKVVGEKGQGEILLLKTDDPYHLNTQAIGKIVVGGNLTREMLLKGIGIGVIGLIGSKISDEDLDYLTEKKFKTPVLRIDELSLKKIIEWEGKKAFIDPESYSVIFLSL